MEILRLTQCNPWESQKERNQERVMEKKIVAAKFDTKDSS